ncbi:MAG: GGDEF domain-containing protein, partial [Treponema sp.]|nr:GGDEF domain-containing protein [Treponema sp.]
RIAELTYKKDRDSTTKLFNKLKYDEMCESYYPLQDSIAVSFWDLNSLKYVNDNFGHAMGDALIETFSSTIYESSSDRCSVYRIGGDEFLVVIDNPSENEMENEVIKIQQKLLHTHKSGGMKVSVAVGVDYGKGSDIQLVVKNADEKMYLDKKNQKEKKQ